MFQNKLGLLDLDEMFTSDMIEIMNNLQDYCPQNADGHIIPIPFGGDGLSVIKAAAAQRGRFDSISLKDKLAGLIPKPEDWHESVIVLQVSIMTLINMGTSHTSREVWGGQ